jgi:hypothetical protein
MGKLGEPSNIWSLQLNYATFAKARDTMEGNEVVPFSFFVILPMLRI